jgi:hypothetical protein
MRARTVGVLATALLALGGCSSGGQRGSGSEAVPPNGVPETGPGTGGSGSVVSAPGGEQRATGVHPEDTARVGADELPRGEEPTTRTFAGQLVEKAGDELRVRAGQQTMPFQVGAETKISKGVEPLRVESLQRGDRLQIRYHKEGNVNVASEVSVTKEPPAPSSRQPSR